MDSEAFLSLLHCVLISCPHSPNPDGQVLLPDSPVYDDGGGERFACQDSVDDYDRSDQVKTHQSSVQSMVAAHARQTRQIRTAKLSPPTAS